MRCAMSCERPPPDSRIRCRSPVESDAASSGATQRQRTEEMCAARVASCSGCEADVNVDAGEPVAVRTRSSLTVVSSLAVATSSDSVAAPPEASPSSARCRRSSRHTASHMSRPCSGSCYEYGEAHVMERAELYNAGRGGSRLENLYNYSTSTHPHKCTRSARIWRRRTSRCRRSDFLFTNANAACVWSSPQAVAAERHQSRCGPPQSTGRAVGHAEKQQGSMCHIWKLLCNEFRKFILHKSKLNILC